MRCSLFESQDLVLTEINYETDTEIDATYTLNLTMQNYGIQI
jgi:hypothetical protein